MRYLGGLNNPSPPRVWLSQSPKREKRQLDEDGLYLSELVGLGFMMCTLGKLYSVKNLCSWALPYNIMEDLVCGKVSYLIGLRLRLMWSFLFTWSRWICCFLRSELVSSFLTTIQNLIAFLAFSRFPCSILLAWFMTPFYAPFYLVFDSSNIIISWFLICFLYFCRYLIK